MQPSGYPTAPSPELGSRIGVRFYRYRAILKRYWWVLALTVGLTLTYQAYQLITKPTRFVSTGKIEVQIVGANEQTSSLIRDPSWYGHIISQLKGLQVRERASREVTLNRAHWLPEIPYTEINAENEMMTYYFLVSGTGRNPEFTQYWVEEVMKAFLQIREDEWNSKSRKDLNEFLEREKKEQDLVNDLRDKLFQLTKAENVPLPEEREETLQNEITQLKRDISDLEKERSVQESMTANDVLTSGRRSTETENPTTATNIVQLKTQLAKREITLAQKREIWRDAHPKMIALLDEISGLKLEIKELEDVASDSRERQLKRINSQINATKEQLTGVEKDATRWGSVMVSYRQIKSNIDTAIAQLNSTKELIARMVNNQKKSGEILSISQHALPSLEEKRAVMRHLLTGLIVGLVIGCGILFLLDRADDRLASSSEMIEQFAEPILGQIPDVATTRTEAGLPLLQEEDERYMFAEAFRSLRSSLIFMPNQSDLKTLIVTSAIPNEGKSTLASNLAITMSAAGAKVLLVDADLRRGDIANLFDIDGRQGLSNVLRGEVQWNATVQEVRGGRLHIIPRGPVTNQSGELLLLPILPKLLDEWRNTYDLVIFNTAPILATDDTPTLAPNFDGTLMVIRASFTSARLTRNALNALYQRQVNVLGLIMNCVDTELPDYYYYRYPKYYAA